MGPREDGKELDGRRHLRLDHVRRAALRVRVVRVDPGAHHQLALVRLADVHVDGVGHDDVRVDRLEQLRHQRLQGMALQRQADPGHRGHHRRMARSDDRHLPGGDRPANGFDADGATVLDGDARDLAVLDQVDAEGVRRPRVAPRDVVVLGDAAARLVGRAEDRVAHVGRHVDDRAQALDVLGLEPLGVDAVEPVRVDPPHALADVVQVVGQVDDTALAEQQVVVELLGQPFPELQRVLVDRRRLVPQVVRADHRRVAGDVPAGEPAALEDGDVRDPVELGEVVGRREAVPAAADDHDVVGALRLRVPPEMLGVMGRPRLG